MIHANAVRRPHPAGSAPGNVRLRLAFATAALTLGLASSVAGAQDGTRLPDMGSSAGMLLGPVQQREYGQMMLAQLRHYEYVLDDPLLNTWLQGVGNRLANSSDRPGQPYTFFWLRDRQINAFATLGGYVGMNAGLVLAAEDEGQVASVLSHEIAHVSQAHVLRSVERAQKDSIPILLAMLGAIALAQSAGGNSSDDAAMAALASAQGLLAQRQIDYTRSNESEADRIGIRTLDRAGYDPNAAAAMFQVMQKEFRSNRGGDRERTPDYLQTHPISSTRIAEAKQRAAQLGKDTMVASTSTPSGGTVSERVPRPGSPVAIANAAGSSGNPLLPSGLHIGSFSASGESGQFDLARERLRVLSADTPGDAIREYEQLRRAGELSAAQAYGLALARLRAGQGAAAAAALEPLLEQRPGDVWLELAMAEADARAGRASAADARLDRLLDRMPNSRPVALTWAQILGERNTPAAGRKAQDILRPLLATSADDPVFQAKFARANEIAGDPVRAGEAYAEVAYLNGRPEQALVQLNTLKKRPELDYYARTRIDARIAAIMPTVLELRRQGIRDDDLED
jgi:predicted Zn-dependent protease